MTDYAGGAPRFSTPPRRPNSIRRTTTHDSARPEGFDAPIDMAIAGRDLLTTADGEAMPVDACTIAMRFDGRTGKIAALAPEPAAARMAIMIGASAYGGFRPLIERALPGERHSHSLRYQLLDELPAAALSSGRAIRMAGLPIRSATSPPPPVDQCAGWQADGALMSGFDPLFGAPLTIGPDHPTVLSDDALAWHAHPPLRPHGTRRRRRFDLWKEGKEAWVDVFFRDSHMAGDGHETVVHEWTLRAAIDLATRTFVGAEATPGPLPYPECPTSMTSAERLAGLRIDDLRQSIRKGFRGPSTCVHLNDTFRALEDAGALLDRLGGGPLRASPDDTGLPEAT